MQFLPVGFTACEHAPNSGDDETYAGDTTNKYPPDIIANLLWDQAIDQGTNYADEAGGGAKHNTYPQDRHRKDEMFAECSPIIEVEFDEVNEEESS